MSGKKRNKKLVIAAVAVMLIGVALVFGWTPLMIYLKKTSNDKEVRVVVDNRNTLEEIAAELQKAGVIKDVDGFLSMAENKKVTIENIEPGMYAFPAHTSYRDLLNSLKSGSFEVEVVVTFNNCKTIHDLCVKVSKCIAVDSTEL